MENSAVLTFAEIEFLLRTAPNPEPTIRQRLRLDVATSDQVAAAGVASLLARGLCTMDGDQVRPERFVQGVIAGLCADRTTVEAVGWIQENPVVLHLFTGPVVRLAVFPAAYGQFRVELLDPAEDASVPVLRFLDACTTTGADEAVAIRAGDGPDRVSIAVAVDSARQWYVSDTEHSPGRGEPTSRQAAGERIRDLLGARS